MGQRQTRGEIALAYAAFILIGLGGGAGGVLLPKQISEYDLNKSVIGLLFFAFSLGYVLAGAANGWLMRRLGPRGDLVVGTATFSVSTFGCALRPAYGVLLALTVLFGFGTGVIDAGLNAHLAALPRSTMMLNLLHAFYGVGALIGPVLAAGILARGFSWGAVYLVFAVVCVPLIVAFARRYPRILPAHADNVAPGVPGEAAAASVRTSILAAALRHPAVLLSALFLAVYVGVEVSLGNWAYSFLVEERGQGDMMAGWVVSGFWLGLTLGRFVLNAVAERFGMGPVALTYACLAGIGGGALVIWLVPATAAAVVGFVLVGSFLGPIFPLMIAVLPRLTPSWLVPTAIGLIIGVSVVGGAFFPWLAGTIAEHLGLGTLLPFTALLSAALLANWWSIARRMAPAH
jgi:fucose permease